MKLLYKMMIFFLVFYGMVIVVNSLGIFPNTLYGDSDLSSPNGIMAALFVPSAISGLGDWTVLAVVGFIAGGAIVTGFITQNIQLPALTIIGILFFNMITKSYGFMTGLFNKVNTRPDSIVYLGYVVGAAIIVVGLITVVEFLGQGGSGGDD